MFLIDLAAEYAATAHIGQPRKGNGVPYFSHPAAVAILLAQAGAREEIIAAGLLHDVIEDAGKTVGEIESLFGEEVARLVDGASEPEHSDRPWEQRKNHTIAYLRDAEPDVRLLACADKVHNARAILRERERLGEKVWERFSRGIEHQRWYYQSLVESLRPTEGEEQLAWLHRQLERVVGEIFEDA